MNAPLLRVRDLRVNFSVYEGEARVLNGVDLYLDRGEAIALVGETGCGKSVTAKAILGLLPVPPARVVGGAIEFKGRDLLRLSTREMQSIRGRGISMVLQDPMTSLNPVFTVGQQLVDNVLWQGQQGVGLWKYFRKGFDRAARAGARARAIEMLDRVRIPQPERTFDRYPVELSGGMRQRVLIALALIGGPELLIADEPGTALDVSIQDQILQLLNELIHTQGTSVIFITHNLGVARAMSRRIYVMYAGEVVETGETAAVFRDQLHPYTRGLLRSIPRLTGEMGEGIDGRIPDFTRPPAGCRFYDRCDSRRERCGVERPPMIEVGPGRLVACHLYG